MAWVLVAAGVYNLVWGGFVVAFPGAIWGWIGAEPPRYPELWQCIGMIVGVYGLGYLAAARDPLRHWPIVLVGFLGKVLGPIGFFDAVVLRDVFPLSFGVTIVTNDLIWWVPFALILWAAFRASQGEDASARPASRDELRSLLDETETVGGGGGTIGAWSRTGRGVLVVLLRHTGCTFCRAMLDDLRARRASLERLGVSVVLVHQSDPAMAGRLFERYGLGDVPQVSDPGRRLYRAIGLGRGTFGQLFGLKSWTRGLAAVLKGHGIGKLEGDGFQMPGAVLVRDGVVVRREAPRLASDRLDFDRLACDVDHPGGVPDKGASPAYGAVT